MLSGSSKIPFECMVYNVRILHTGVQAQTILMDDVGDEKSRNPCPAG